MSTYLKSALRFHARAVFVDFGGTLIFNRQQTSNGEDYDRLLITLADILAKQKSLKTLEARRRVLEVAENLPRTLNEFADRLGIIIDNAEATGSLNGYIQWLSSVYQTDPDAASCLRQFRKQGLKLWPATTHSGLLCAMKLEAVGLGGEPFFEELSGGKEVHPMGKMTRGFYTRLLEKANVAPEEVVHIGESHIWDRDLPMNAGIRQIILLDPRLQERYLQGENGELYVKGWSVIRHLIAPVDQA